MTASYEANGLICALDRLRFMFYRALTLRRGFFLLLAASPAAPDAERFHTARISLVFHIEKACNCALISRRKPFSAFV